MKHSLERSKSSNPVEISGSATQMKKSDRDELMELLEGMTPDEINAVKRVIEKFERKSKKVCD